MIKPSLRRAKLKELAGFEVTGRFEDNLYRLTCITGELLGARRVSLMLLDSGAEREARLKLAALYGELPETAWKEETPPGQGIAGHVLASGDSLHVADIDVSRWRTLARRRGDRPGGFLSCPIGQPEQPVGVLNVSEPIERAAFSRGDLDTAELAALLIDRAIQVARLRRMLDSRFAQMAFTLEGAADACSVLSLSAHEPDRVARMLAKAFYRELRHCGFTSNQIIRAAGEIISELTGSLNRHRDRLREHKAGGRPPE